MYGSHNSSQTSLHQEGDDLLSGFTSSGPISQAASSSRPAPAPAAAQADPFDMFHASSVPTQQQQPQQQQQQQQPSSDLLQGFGDLGETPASVSLHGGKGRSAGPR